MTNTPSKSKGNHAKPSRPTGSFLAAESEPATQGVGMGTGPSASPRAFEEGAESNRYQGDLQAAVGCDAADRFLDRLEVAGLDGDLVNVYGRQQRPDNADDGIDKAV